ncbi:hypothetical protein PMLGA01_130020900 [Plasmodium malariae]|uniref:Uncharacterized protein n=1 Tax=Plasmodium malariae TaxID=5858 RepID=A0A1C3KEU6_PLAMA|nr:hypothetical protein PMLGA01_130020900 [Plasmodium malariae]
MNGFTQFLGHYKLHNKHGEKNCNRYLNSMYNWGSRINNWGSRINNWGSRINNWGNRINNWGNRKNN